MTASVALTLQDPSGAPAAVLRISALPRSEAPEDRTHDPGRLRSEPAIQLREARVYRYELEGFEHVGVRLEPAELFDADDVSGRRGRLHTREYVGDVVAAVVDEHGQVLAAGGLLVRAAKLEHEHEYQRMLREIADLAAEAVLQGFAPARTRASIQPGRAPRLLYQQFAILEARLADPELTNAIAEVTHRPHRDWVREAEWKPPGRPLRVGAHAARALTAPGRRVRAAVPVGPLTTVPSMIAHHRTEETTDTIPNRFVKFALEHWRELAARLGELLDSRQGAAYGRRGRAAVDRVVETLDGLLGERLFVQVGRLHEMPTSNQVLLKREGYRQIFATFALIESSLDLQLELDDAINPSQRNIASLYEYWTFLKLVEVLGQRCQDPRAALRLFETQGDGLALGLRRGRESKLHWDVVVAGRELGVSVYFNRTFATSSRSSSDGSWSRAMVPDASVLVRPTRRTERVEGQSDMDVWLHFDAKYKVDWSTAQFERVRPEREPQLALEEEDEEREGSSRREDLLKMHAYRDAIRRSAGAYVLFPGRAQPLEFREYVELIPGLGAFPLRPGSEAGPAALGRFLGDVLLHAADQATAEERSRFWRARVVRDTPASSLGRYVQFLDAPPADTWVLVGFVPTQEAWDWASRRSEWVTPVSHNGRGLAVDADELAASLILLSGAGQAELFARTGAWELMTETDLDALAYPAASEAPALLCRLDRFEPQPVWLIDIPLVSFSGKARLPGGPVLVNWSDLVGSGSTDGEPGRMGGGLADVSRRSRRMDEPVTIRPRPPRTTAS